MKRLMLIGAALVAGLTIWAATLPTPSPIPDPKLTPGAIDPTVTQANLQQTICQPGYAKAKRPPDNLAWRRRMARIHQAYGVQYQRGLYEDDHAVAIEIGGAPNDGKNLWPEAANFVVDGFDEGYHQKDLVENAVRHAVCSDEIALTDAQKQMASDWRVLYLRFIGPFPRHVN